MEKSEMEDDLEKYMARTKKWLEAQLKGPGYSSQEMEDQWRRNHELSLQRKKKRTNRANK